MRWLISEAAHVIVMWWLILNDLVEKWRLSGGSVAAQWRLSGGSLDLFSFLALFTEA